jgi:hypothetical protein
MRSLRRASAGQVPATGEQLQPREWPACQPPPRRTAGAAPHLGWQQPLDISVALHSRVGATGGGADGEMGVNGHDRKAAAGTSGTANGRSGFENIAADGGKPSELVANGDDGRKALRQGNHAATGARCTSTGEGVVERGPAQQLPSGSTETHLTQQRGSGEGGGRPITVSEGSGEAGGAGHPGSWRCSLKRAREDAGERAPCDAGASILSMHDVSLLLYNELRCVGGPAHAMIACHCATQARCWLDAPASGARGAAFRASRVGGASASGLDVGPKVWLPDVIGLACTPAALQGLAAGCDVVAGLRLLAAAKAMVPWLWRLMMRRGCWCRSSGWERMMREEQEAYRSQHPGDGPSEARRALRAALLQRVPADVKRRGVEALRPLAEAAVGAMPAP